MVEELDYLRTMSIKNQKAILSKLGIQQLNPMQEAAQEAIQSNRGVLLLSPTGSGKTLAFLLPLIAKLNPQATWIQALILVPSRELAIQIESVLREMGTGYKTNAVYGGKSFSKDRTETKHAPAILIGTPGRVADHLRRHTFDTEGIETLVLDEFDKSLEIGFESDMMDIISHLPSVKQRILTSATQGVEIPFFVGLHQHEKIDFLGTGESKLEIKQITSPSKDKLETLVNALCHLGNEPGIVFCNFKDSIQRVSDHLTECGIHHGCFYGGMEQMDRERALVKFRNGTHQLIIATDLAARGLDIPEIKFIIHYHLPNREEEFTHRNGRTARMHSDGSAYVLLWKGERRPDFIGSLEEEVVLDAPVPKPGEYTTLLLSGGRKDKISKGDIAGLFFKQGGLVGDDLGTIELKNDCAFVAVKTNKVDQLIDEVNDGRIKRKKVKVRVI